MNAPRERIHIDSRPGGTFETVMVNDADGSEYPTHGVYDELRPPERLAWTEPGSGMRVTTDFLEVEDGRTEVRICQINVPELIATEEAKAGFLTSLDRFAAYLGTLRASQPNGAK